MSRLVVVSNRCNVPRRGSAPGGLAVALTSALRERGGLWFGWDGNVAESSRRRASLQTVDGVDYATVPLNRRDYDAYYKGYANRVLWPLFHYRIDAMQYEQGFEAGYQRTNDYLARKLLPLLGPDDLIWVHDYHLLPLGRALRIAGVESPIGFFLHIPFPPFDVMRALPGYRRLLRHFSAYDLVGFQTDYDTSNYIDSVQRGVGARTRASGTVEWGRNRARAVTCPISIDVDEAQQMARAGRDSRTVRRLAASLRERQLVLGVDRLDYSKGLPDRCRAFESMLTRYPETMGEVVFLQVAQPSREDVPEYTELRLELERLVGEINGRHAEFDWVPLRYLNKAYARSTVMSFLALAAVGLVTPLRDGMNLVAKEFIAAQDESDPGVLVLSEMTGAARELDSALVVNPHDHLAVADALLIAFKMPLAERRDRWQAAMAVLRGNDIFNWSRRFVRDLAAVRR